MVLLLYSPMSMVHQIYHPLQVSYIGYECDRKGQITKVAIALEGNWTYSYDPLGQMVKWTNSQGAVTTYTYDGIQVTEW